jgi:hypothetical protein
MAYRECRRLPSDVPTTGGLVVDRTEHPTKLRIPISPQKSAEHRRTSIRYGIRSHDLRPPNAARGHQPPARPRPAATPTRAICTRAAGCGVASGPICPSRTSSLLSRQSLTAVSADADNRSGGGDGGGVRGRRPSDSGASQRSQCTRHPPGGVTGQMVWMAFGRSVSKSARRAGRPPCVARRFRHR